MNIFFSTKRLQAIATVIKILLCSMKDELFSGYFYHECFTIEYSVCSRVYKSMSVQHYKFYILILSEVSLFLCKCFLFFLFFFWLSEIQLQDLFICLLSLLYVSIKYKMRINLKV